MAARVRFPNKRMTRAENDGGILATQILHGFDKRKAVAVLRDQVFALRKELSQLKADRDYLPDDKWNAEWDRVSDELERVTSILKNCGIKT